MARKTESNLESGTVYFVQAASGGPIKIGFARDMEKRLQSLQTAHPEPLEVLLSLQGTLADEQAFHRQFRGLWVRGEWFDDKEELSAFIRSHKQSQRAVVHGATIASDAVASVDSLRGGYRRFGERVHALITDFLKRERELVTDLTEAKIYELAGGIVNPASLHRLLHHAPQSGPYDRLDAIAAAFGFRLDVSLRRISGERERRERVAAIREALEQ